MDAINLLMEFGLTRQEATLYLGLLSEGDQNGYELAKKTGISRSNAYTSLAGLVDKGAAWTLEGETVRYRAVPGAEFTANRLRRWERLRTELLPLLPMIQPKAGSYVTVRGKEAIFDRMRTLVGQTRERLYLSLDHEILATLIPELSLLSDRGCKLVLLSNPAGCAMLSKSCNRAVIHKSEPKSGQIRIIVDSLHAMTGEISAAGESSCLYSDHPNLVELFKTSLKNEIRLATLEKDMKKNRKRQ
jgi:sugar-specific transcriptional regulator TrmB